jgi:WD40 repeat protein
MLLGAGDICATANEIGVNTNQGHGTSIWALEISPDDKWIITGDENGAIKLWDSRTLRLVRSWSVGPYLIQSLTFLPDSRRVLVGFRTQLLGQPNKFILTDIDAGDVAQIYQADFAAFSPSSKGSSRQTLEKELARIRAGTMGGLTHAGVSFSADESQFISSDNFYTRVWDFHSGKLLRHAKSSATFSSNLFVNDKDLILGQFWRPNGKDKAVALFSFQQNKIVRSFKVTVSKDEQPVLALAAQGRRGLVGTRDGTIFVLNLDSSEPVRVLKHPPKNLESQFSRSSRIRALCLSRDGRYGVGTVSGGVWMFDLSNGSTVWSHNTDYRTFEKCRISPVGDFVVMGSFRDLHLLNAKTGETIASSPGVYREMRGATVSPDGRVLVGEGAVWSATTGQRLREFRQMEQGGRQKPVSFTASGLFSSLDRMTNAIELIDAGNLVVRATVNDSLDGQSSTRLQTFYSLSGETFFTLDDKMLRAWDASSGQALWGVESRFQDASLSPDGRLVAAMSSSTDLSILDARTGGLVKKIKLRSEHRGVIGFLPDNRTVLLAGGSTETLASAIDNVTGTVTRSYRGEIPPGRINFDQVGIKERLSPDGRWLAIWTNDLIQVFETSTGRLKKVDVGVGGVEPTSLNRVIGSLERIGADDPLGRILRQSHTRPRLAVFSDGAMAINDTWLIYAGADWTIKLWNLSSGRTQRSCSSDSDVIDGLSISADGKRIYSSAKDGTLKVWRLDDCQLLATMTGDPRYPEDWVTVTPEGFFDAGGHGARRLNIVRGLAVYSIDQVYNALYRPDLVREKLAGDPDGKVRTAAAQLDLDKVMASGAAPNVAITSPASGVSSATDEVAIEATVADQGGGVGKVEWRVNGVTLGLESRGLDRLDATTPGGSASGKTETVKRTLALEPGDNRIEIVAYNARGLIASEPAQVTIKWDGTKTATPPKLYVLAVGVNDYYDSRLRLTYAVPDAKALADGFQKAGTGLYAGVEIRTVLDSDVTLTNLDKVFREMSQKVKSRDVFVFFLAGHGKTKNGRYYFLPRDFRYEDETSIEKTGMGQDKFQAWFASISARKSLLLYDTCESGSLTGLNARGSDVDERLGALNRMARATGRTFLTATTDDAPALEGFRGHGVFTYALLDALDHADINKNGLIEVSELADYIDQKVPDYSFEAFKLRQVPQRSIVGNNFSLTNKTEVLAETPPSPKTDLIPTKPTHVVIMPVDVRSAANETASTVNHLTSGMQVRLIEATNGWVLIARDGQKIGYVRGSAIVGLQ